MIPGIGPISGGQGGISADLGAGPSRTGDQRYSGGGNTWNFAPPQYQVQANQQQAAGQQWASVAIIAAGLGMAWLLTRK